MVRIAATTAADAARWFHSACFSSVSNNKYRPSLFSTITLPLARTPLAVLLGEVFTLTRAAFAQNTAAANVANVANTMMVFLSISNFSKVITSPKAIVVIILSSH